VIFAAGPFRLNGVPSPIVASNSNPVSSLALSTHSNDAELFAVDSEKIKFVGAAGGAAIALPAHANTQIIDKHRREKLFINGWAKMLIL
jgi:hypothetical protein